jgi:hypothetical protein
MTRVMLDDDDPPARSRRRAVLDDDMEPMGAKPVPQPGAQDRPAAPSLSRFKAPVDPFDRDHPIRVPTDVAKLASRFAHEAVAGLRLELHSRTGRARTAAAQQLLGLALHAPDAATIEAVETLTDEALDAQLAEIFKAEGIEEQMAEYGFIKARSDTELRRVQAILNRPRGHVA